VRRAATISLDPAELRLAGAAMVAGGAALQLLPVHPPIFCPLRAMTGIPCPLCGMTTSVEATLRLDFADAAAATPAGIVAVTAAVVLLVVRPAALRLPAPALYVALAAMWVYQLHRFSFL
jgi:hypothetical protein